MSAWKLVPALDSLRGEFTQLSPSRDKTSDGAVGDAAHQKAGTSDHLPDEDTPALRAKDPDKVNEVHAIDLDNNLNKPGWTMDRCVQIIVLRHRTGVDTRLQYVIWNRLIWSASWGWTARAYNGPSPHTEHAHFSCRYTTAQENDTRPWGLVEAARATSSSTTMSRAPGTRLLRQGMSGSDVAFLQRWTGAKDDGSYGAATTERVKRYQRIVGLTADGVCGAATWSRILGRKVNL